MNTVRRLSTIALLPTAASLALATAAAVVDGPADTFAEDRIAVQLADGPNGNYAYLNDDELVFDVLRSNPNLDPDLGGSIPTRSPRWGASSQIPTHRQAHASRSTTRTRTSPSSSANARLRARRRTSPSPERDDRDRTRSRQIKTRGHHALRRQLLNQRRIRQPRRHHDRVDLNVAQQQRR